MAQVQEAITVEGLYTIFPLTLFRKTPGVFFNYIPNKHFPKIDSIDQVIHDEGAISPGPVDEIARPWYMHPYQADNLLVLHGTRHVDIYTPEHGKVENFIVSPYEVLHNGEKVFDGAAMLVWPQRVFHRIRSGETGSASINLATHYEGFNIRNNFNIYSLNTDTGEFHVIREGHLDQDSITG